jgi:murein L,D-transpeptidase YafK
MWRLLGFNGPAVQVQDAEGRPIAVGLDDLLAGLEKHWNDDKSDRKLYLYKAGRVLREFDVSLGLVPTGPKQREGDFRTPEGKYMLDARNANSDFFLSIHVSYPSEADRARARTQGVDPGGQIMIHGLPNEPKYDLRRYEDPDWTDGCIAVSNSDMVDIWLMTRESTPIEIRP